MNNVEVLYEDNHIIIVNKPCNILSQSDITGDIDMLTLIKKYLKEKYHKPGNVYLGLVHRLDRPVSGVMVFAKTSKAASRLSEQVRTKKIEKTYLAIIHGIMKNKKGTMEDYLEKLPSGNTIVTTKEKGKFARLTYEVLDENIKKDISLVKINLETGRHHQIRVQFASRNNSLCGDSRYGIKDNKQIALHCFSLSFIHPVKQEKMFFSILPNREDYWTEFTL